MRIRPGDAIAVLNGEGGKGYGVFTGMNGKCAELRLDRVEIVKTPQARIHVAIAPPKTADRWEWILEKAVEFGVASVQPLITGHSERKKINEEKARMHLVQAMKQCKNPFLPVLHPMRKWRDFLAEQHRETDRFIAYCGAEPVDLLMANISVGNSVLVAIGPEGDFMPEEVAMAREKGFGPCWLGERILRTESAMLEAVTQFNHRQWISGAVSAPQP